MEPFVDVALMMLSAWALCKWVIGFQWWRELVLGMILMTAVFSSYNAQEAHQHTHEIIEHCGGTPSE